MHKRTCTCSGNDHSDPNGTFYTVNDITTAVFPKIVSCGKLIPVKGSTIQRCQQRAKIIYVQPVCYCKTIPTSQSGLLQAIINTYILIFFLSMHHHFFLPGDC